jgi:hypothetical protein
LWVFGDYLSVCGRGRDGWGGGRDGSIGFKPVRSSSKESEEVWDIAFDGLDELCSAATVFVAFVGNFSVPAFDEGDLMLGKLEITATLFEGFDFFDAAGTKVANAAHAALVQPNAGLSHFSHAAFDLAFPEHRPILLEPERHLPELAVEHLQAGTGFVLENLKCSSEASEGIRGFDIGGTRHGKLQTFTTAAADIPRPAAPCGADRG